MDKNEAIEVLKKYQYDPEVREALECLHPELKESEDERIRKNIIKSITDLSAEWIELHGVTKEEALSWLEKQGKQKSAWSEEDEKMIEFWNLYYEHKVGDMPNKDVVENLEKFRDWLKSLKERFVDFDIEKAVSYIQQNWIWNTKIIEDFRNYMKGE